MSRIIVLGAGVVGLSTAMMLKARGHDVTVFERDPEPLPASPDEAWFAWERQGVTQFRQAHFLHAAGHHAIDCHLPDVKEALTDAGCVRFDLCTLMPPFIQDREPREGDDRFVTITGAAPLSSTRSPAPRTGDCLSSEESR